MLGKKTMEVEILKEAVEYGQLRKVGVDDNVIVYKGNAIIVLSWRVKKRAYLNDKRAAVQALSGYSIPVVTVKVRVCCGAT